MSVNIELLSEIYPEWERQMPPVMVIAAIVLAIAVFTLISYLNLVLSAKNKSEPEIIKPTYECDVCGEIFNELMEFCPQCGIEFDLIETAAD